MNRIAEREHLVRDAQEGRISLAELWTELRRTYAGLTPGEQDVDYYNAEAELEGLTSHACGK